MSPHGGHSSGGHSRSIIRTPTAIGYGRPAVRTAGLGLRGRGAPGSDRPPPPATPSPPRAPMRTTTSGCRLSGTRTGSAPCLVVRPAAGRRDGRCAFRHQHHGRAGARFGPKVRALHGLRPSTYHLDLGIRLYDWLDVVDNGDALQAILPSHGRSPGCWPRAHYRWSSASITRSPGRTPPSPEQLDQAHFSARADTADILEGNLASHGTPMRRLIGNRGRCAARTSSRSGCAGTGRHRRRSTGCRRTR